MTENKGTWGVKYRPRELEDMIGNESSIKVVKSWKKNNSWPNVIHLVGSSGRGKTTLARIIAHMAATEVINHNCISKGSKDDIEHLVKAVEFQPRSGGRRVIIMDEIHGLGGGTSKAAASTLLVPLEIANHNIWITCTDNPDKVLATIRGRGVTLQLQLPTEDQLVGLGKRILKKEGFDRIKDKRLAVLANAVGRQPRLFLNSLKTLAESGGSMDAVRSEIAKTEGKPADMLAKIISKDVKAACRSLAENDPMALYMFWTEALLANINYSCGGPKPNYIQMMCVPKGSKAGDLISVMQCLNHARERTILSGADPRSALMVALYATYWRN